MCFRAVPAHITYTDSYTAHKLVLETLWSWTAIVLIWTVELSCWKVLKSRCVKLLFYNVITQHSAKAHFFLRIIHEKVVVYTHLFHVKQQTAIYQSSNPFFDVFFRRFFAFSPGWSTPARKHSRVVWGSGGKDSHRSVSVKLQIPI